MEICSDLLLFHSLALIFWGASFSSAAEDFCTYYIFALVPTNWPIRRRMTQLLAVRGALQEFKSACSYSIYQGICLRTYDDKMPCYMCVWSSVRWAVMTCTWLNVLSDTEEINRSEQSFSKSCHQMKRVIFKSISDVSFFDSFGPFDICLSLGDLED